VATVSVEGRIRVGGLIGQSTGEIINSEATGTVTAAGYSAGGLVGSDRGRIESSAANGDVSGRNAVGGLTGFHTGTTTSSEAAGDVEGNEDVGGLIGRNNLSDVSSSKASGNVVGESNVGGLVGFNNGRSTLRMGNISNSEAIGDVDGTGARIGGLVGKNSLSTVESSVARGEVKGGDRVGGLVGYNEDNAVVTISYSEGAVSGDEEVGGLVGVNGDNSETTESFAAGTTSGNQDVGGLIGVNAANVSTSFWDTEATGQDAGVGRGDPDGVTGLTTDEMQGESAQQNMDGFDFQDTWQVVTGDYPALFWEEN
jgi:hypothetical protein